MLAPVFVKGHLAFSLAGINLEYTHQNLSAYGVMGLPWEGLNSREHFGKTVQLALSIETEEPLKVKANGIILREYTVHASYMGIKFSMDLESKKQLEDQIKKYGFYPTAYIRKHPRIPSTSSISTFPLRVSAVPDTFRDPTTGRESAPMILEVLNLSPNGVLLSTENQASLSVQPGEQIDMVFEPRGWFPVPVKVRGLICRISDDINLTTGNFTRQMGIKFTKVDDVNRTAFLDLLRDILKNIKDPSILAEAARSGDKTDPNSDKP